MRYPRAVAAEFNSCYFGWGLSPIEPCVAAPEPSLPAEPAPAVVEILDDELEKSRSSDRSSDGSFAKVSAVRLSDEENDSEYSLLLQDESASYGGA